MPEQKQICYEYLIDFLNPETNEYISTFEGARGVNVLTLVKGEKDVFGNTVDGWMAPLEIVRKVVKSTKNFDYLEFRILMRRRGDEKWRECIFFSKKIRPSIKKILDRLEEMKEKLSKE